MIIAVDFDGTLCLDDGTPNIRLIQRLKQAQREGNTVILWTCREGNSLREAVRFLGQFGLVPDYFNQNCPEIVRRNGRDSRKIYADVYIDDKAIK